jgi:hypothetical protein
MQAASPLIVLVASLAAHVLASCGRPPPTTARRETPAAHPVVERAESDRRPLATAERARGPDPDPRVCPGTVRGARTRLANIPEGVEITITGRSRKARDEIRRRAAVLTTVRQLTPAESAAARSCLVAYYPGTAAEMTAVPGGVRVRVTASKPEDGDALRRITRERAEALATSGGSTAATAPGSRG